MQIEFGEYAHRVSNTAHIFFWRIVKIALAKPFELCYNENIKRLGGFTFNGNRVCCLVSRFIKIAHI